MPTPKPARQTQPRIDGGFELGDRPESVDLNERASKRSMTGAIRVPRVRAGKEALLEERESPKEEGTKPSVISSEYKNLLLSIVLSKLRTRARATPRRKLIALYLRLSVFPRGTLELVLGGRLIYMVPL